MMPGGFVDEVGETVQKGWNWLTGRTTANSTENVVPQHTEELPSAVTPPTLTPVPKELIHTEEFTTALGLLQIECNEITTQKVREKANEFKNHYDKSKELKDLSTAITECTNDHGKLKIDPDNGKLKELFRKGRAHGLNINEKELTHDKFAVSKLTANVDNEINKIQTDITINQKQMQECENHRNTCFQILKTMWDKIAAVISKIADKFK